ncbi:MAG: peptidoglycan recognition family protein [Planctomycetaceae bacterium]
MRTGTIPSEAAANHARLRRHPGASLGLLLAVSTLSSLVGCARSLERMQRQAAIKSGDVQPVSEGSAGHRAVSVKTVDWTNFPWRPQARSRDWTCLVIHHTATEIGSVESIHREHRERRDGDGNRWQGIGYHFVIGNGRGMEDGAIEPTFRWREQLAGAHAGVGDYNEQGIGICLVGNFEKESPTTGQLTSLKRLVAALLEQYEIPPERVLRHRDVKATACPGRYFSMQDVIPAAEAVLSEEQHLSSTDR